MRKLIFLFSLIPAALVAQTGSADPNVAMARGLWQEVHRYIEQSAADVPDSLYGFRPTPEVRSFGELLGHVAGAERVFCALALGEPAPAEDAVEKSARTKAALVEALQASRTFCEKAYSQSDKAAGAMARIFGAQQPRLYALLMNATHDNEHYGNIVTYMRLNHMVPPSSRPSR